MNQPKLFPSFYICIHFAVVFLLQTVLLTTCLVSSVSVQAKDVVWGLTSNVGPSVGGIIFSLKSDKTDFTVRHTFQSTPIYPQGNLIKGIDGSFNGMTSGGGYYGNGNIFKISPDDTSFVRSFKDSTDAASP